jgi:hypothetical protein
MVFNRIKQRLRQIAFTWSARKVLLTPQVSCNPHADCTIHTMLGAKDLNMYLIAIKSLLSEYNSLQVTIHSDGTLQRRDHELIESHISGCRIITKEMANGAAAKELGTASYLYRCRNIDVNYRRLIDTSIWNSTTKRIIMDSDVITLTHPTEVIEWIETRSGAFLLGKRQCDSPLPEPPDLSTKHVQIQFRARLEQISQLTGFPARFAQGTTAGFYGCECELRLELVERVIRACESLNLSLHHWGGDQCIVIYLLTAANAYRLSEELYLNFWPDEEQRVDNAHIVHFLGTNRHDRGVYRRVAGRRIGELRLHRS